MRTNNRQIDSFYLPCIAMALCLGTIPAMAAETGGGETSVLETQGKLTPAEEAEREGRKACKIQICKAFHDKTFSAENVSCDIVKSWRKEQVSKLVAKLKVTWPYGPVRCTSKVNLKRADLLTALDGTTHDMTLDTHTVHCTIDREKEPATEITFDFAPKVTFESGKATKAQMRWGKIVAPSVIKSALWTATAADNTVNILSGTLVTDINDFVSNKCDEVKDTWAAKQ